MVEQGLWDGCSFMMVANEVMKAVPLSCDGSPAKVANSFRDAYLNGPVFKEFNDEFQHSPYSLGFAGRGSRSFFIIAENNADLHPADTAFGKVIAGFDALSRMNAHHIEAGPQPRDRVGVKSTECWSLRSARFVYRAKSAR